jgi:hypothetical protein
MAGPTRRGLTARSPWPLESAMPNWWADSDAVREALTRGGRLPRPPRKFDLEQVRPGWLVVDNERQAIGRVSGQIDRYVVVQRAFHGFYLWLRLYVPESAIGEAHQGTLALNVSRGWVASMGWDRPPRQPPKARRNH